MLDPLETETDSNRAPQGKPGCKSGYSVASFLLFLLLFAMICSEGFPLISIPSSESVDYIRSAPKDLHWNEEKSSDATPTEEPRAEVETAKPEIPEVLYEDDLPWLFGGHADSQLPSRETYRLPEWIHPLSYVVNLTVQIKGVNGADRSTFQGTALLKFRVDGQSTEPLEFHVGNYELEMNSLSSRDGRSVQILSNSRNARKGTVVLQLDQSLQAGEEYTLSLAWRGAARHDDRGLYEMWFTDQADGAHHYALGTFGEPMGTRLWMPCFDEPAMKAILHLTIEHPSSFTARSNARVLEKRTLGDASTIARTTFHPTPLMSTYLFALSVTDYVEKRWEYQGIPLSVALPPSIPAGAFDIIVPLANKSVHQFMTSLKAPIIFDKIDFIFFTDFLLSAMENVGHITFALRHGFAFELYVHEMMHNFFGNLVTLSWWDEVWLNEALTSLYEKEMSVLEESKAMTFTTLKEQAMASDSFRRTIPLYHQATAEVSTMDILILQYQKGPVVLRMMGDVLGKEAWTRGIEKYLNKFAYKAVTGEDFLSTLEEEAKKYQDEEIVEFAIKMTRDFLNKMGFPLLRITRVGNRIKLTQERFHIGFINGNQKEDKDIWALPVHLMKLDGTPYKTVFMTSKSMEIEVDTEETLILSTDEIVYYRAVYDAETYNQISKSELSDGRLDPIIQDLLFSASSGYYDMDSALTFLTNEKIAPKLNMFALEFSPIEASLKSQLISLLTETDSNQAEKEQPVSSNDECNGVNDATVFDAYYKTQNIALFFCSQVVKSWDASGYKKLVKRILAANESSLFHEGDVKGFFDFLSRKKPDVIADALLEMVRDCDSEITIASMIYRASAGLTEFNTKQLRQIAEISPWAALQNKLTYLNVFGLHHSHETERKVLGEKFSRAIERAKAKRKSGRRKMAKSGRKPLKPVQKPFQFTPTNQILII